MRTILVTGATGQQGGAVVRALQAANVPDVKIRVLTRNPQSSAAQALKAQDVETSIGNLNNILSLEAALYDCEVAYLVTDFRGPGDVQGEVEQGQNFVIAAKRAGVKHIVFSSVAGSEDKSVEHFYSKFRIETIIHESGISSAVVRPVGFMEVIPPAGLARNFMLSTMEAVFGETQQKWIACEDIGKTVARALLQPDQFSGKVLTVCGDVKTIEEVRVALARGENSAVAWKLWLPRWLVLLLSPYHYRQMFEWLATGIQPGNVERTRGIIADAMDIESWARKQLGQ